MRHLMNGMLSLFGILFMKNLILFIIPEGKSLRLAKDVLQIMILLWVLGVVFSFFTEGDDALQSGITDNGKDLQAFSDAENELLKETCERTLAEQAEAVLQEEGMRIERITVRLEKDGRIGRVRVELIPENLKSAFIEIRIQDIELADPASDPAPYYRKILAQCWAIPEETVSVTVRR